MSDKSWISVWIGLAVLAALLVSEIKARNTLSLGMS
jgi:hypothetical protein